MTKVEWSRKGAQYFLLEERVVEEGKLTPQELLVICWLRKAKTDEEIGEIMGRKVGTLKKHLARIYDKLGVEDRTEPAAAFYADRFFTVEE